MIDLFRPYVDQTARFALFDLLTPHKDTGRLYIGQGEHVESFENELKEMLGSERDVLTTNSCTSALDLALHLCNVGTAQTPAESTLKPPMDVVITTPMTCTATNGGIVTRGSQILWADVDPLTGLIDPSSVATAVERSLLHYGVIPKAIMAVDWGGHLCNYPALRRAARHESIPIIQDAAHSFGATVDGKPFLATEQHGDYAAFSFQAIKLLTTGDGGALVCPNPMTTERARLLRWYGLDRRSSANFRCSQSINEVGYKFHLNDIAATIGLYNLPHVEHLLHTHRQNALFYAASLRNLNGVLAPSTTQGPIKLSPDAAWWLFTLLVSDRGSFIEFLANEGIEASPVHARNDHHPAFARAALEESLLPGVEFFASHEVAIPVGWWVTEREREKVASAVMQWSWKHGSMLVPPRTLQEV